MTFDSDGMATSSDDPGEQTTFGHNLSSVAVPVENPVLYIHDVKVQDVKTALLNDVLQGTLARLRAAGES